MQQAVLGSGNNLGSGSWMCVAKRASCSQQFGMRCCSFNDWIKHASASLMHHVPTREVYVLAADAAVRMKVSGVTKACVQVALMTRLQLMQVNNALCNVEKGLLPSSFDRN